MGLLREKGIEFAWFDILSDEDVRQGLKKVNDWPSELCLFVWLGSFCISLTTNCACDTLVAD